MKKALSKREKVLIAIIIILSIALLVCLSELMSKNTSSKSTKTDNDTVETTGDESSSTQAIKDSESIKDEEKGDFNNISIDDYLELKKGSEKSIIFIARPTCEYCAIQEPITRYLVYKYGLEINYLNTDEMEADAQNKLTKSSDIFKDGVSTPTTLIVQNDEVVDAVIGLMDLEHYTKFFKDYGLIN